MLEDFYRELLCSPRSAIASILANIAVLIIGVMITVAGTHFDFKPLMFIGMLIIVVEIFLGLIMVIIGVFVVKTNLTIKIEEMLNNRL